MKPNILLFVFVKTLILAAIIIGNPMLSHSVFAKDTDSISDRRHSAESDKTPVVQLSASNNMTEVGSICDIYGKSSTISDTGQISWYTFSAGAGDSHTDNEEMDMTIGIAITDNCSSENYSMGFGYWQIIAEAPGEDCCNYAGDANDDGSANVADAVYLINYVFKSGPAPVCMNEGDANADCSVNVADAVYVINYVFKSGPPPTCGCVE